MDYIKKEIKRLYEKGTTVHISIKIKRPKLVAEDAPVRIVGVYSNIFQIEESGGDYPIRRTLQYADVLVGNVKIKELDFAPPASASKKSIAKGRASE